MKTLKKKILIATILSPAFITGVTLTQKPDEPAEQGLIHLSCWDETGESSIERIRFTVNQQGPSRYWLSNFEGEPLSEGVLEQKSPHRFVASVDQTFEAQLPPVVYQKHIRSLTVSFENSQGTKMDLQCRKSVSLASR